MLSSFTDGIWFWLIYNRKNFGCNSVIFQNHRIRGLLEKCSLDHEARMENLQNEMRARALYDAKWRQIQQNLNHSVSMTACYQKAVDYQFNYFLMILIKCFKWWSVRHWLLCISRKYKSSCWFRSISNDRWTRWCF